MVDISFYRIKTGPIDGALRKILSQARSRGWRVAIQAGSDARIRGLDDYLWAFEPESFLPHGTRADASPETQPVYLTTADDNPNNAEVRIFLEGVRIAPRLAGETAPSRRAILMFEEDNSDELENAREQWRELRDLGQTLVYWRQDENGRWVEMAREPKATA
jgi:DNA polymerase-3 subunit chi